MYSTLFEPPPLGWDGVSMIRKVRYFVLSHIQLPPHSQPLILLPVTIGRRFLLWQISED